MRVAIIGAGASGLAAIKCCLDEGLQPVCFEREDDIGGLWNYSEDPVPGRGSVYKSCTINISKEMMAYSDFPPPEHFPPFMPHALVLNYFRLYAEKFDLLRYIKFRTSVEGVKKASDYDATGRWVLTLRNDEDSPSHDPTHEVFDAVMVCSGHHVFPNLPELRGLAEFRGAKLHSHDYKRPEKFADKRVLIIGIGNSAVDIAVDLSRLASRVHVSTRRGAWIISRMGPFGYPADALANTRFSFTLPRAWLQRLVEVMANFRFNHANYGLRPRHRALEAHPTINDDLPHRIMTGDVVIKPDISCVSSSGVTFTDGSYEDYDVIIMATGYNYHIKYIDRSVLDIEDNEVPLYKYVFPPELAHPTLGVIGLVQAIGAVIPIAEMQSRWFTRVITGRARLPSPRLMLQDMYKTRNKMADQYVTSTRHTLQTFWIAYMDEIAAKIGAKPSFCRLLLRDPALAARCYFGPCVPTQYRLYGAGAWPGAAAAIRRSFSSLHAGTKHPGEPAAPGAGQTMTTKGPGRLGTCSEMLDAAIDKIGLWELVLFLVYVVVTAALLSVSVY